MRNPSVPTRFFIWVKWVSVGVLLRYPQASRRLLSLRSRFTRSRPPTKFWDNLKRLQDMTEEGTLVQYSVFLTHDMRGALAARDLVKHYKGDVILFRGYQPDDHSLKDLCGRCLYTRR